MTYLVFVEENNGKNLAGFISFLSDSVRIKENKELESEFNIKGITYSYLPAMKIGRMAVDERQQRRGIGHR